MNRPEMSHTVYKKFLLVHDFTTCYQESIWHIIWTIFGKKHMNLP